MRPGRHQRVSRRGALAWLAAPGALLATTRPGQASARTPLTVSAAASLADALRALAPRFEAAHPGLVLRLNLAASGVLLQQIAQGAPADVFIPADSESMDRAVAQRLVDPATRRDIARNTVVMVVPLQNAPPLNALADLAGPAVRRIAIGKAATVPAGRYARQALQAAGLLPAIEPKLVPADHVRQVLDYVARGEVEAGFVYRTDAAVARDRLRIAAPLGGHTPVAYPAAVVADARQAAAAAAFIGFLLGDAAQAVLASFGFGRP